jgi:hypothetical protein
MYSRFSLWMPWQFLWAYLVGRAQMRPCRFGKQNRYNRLISISTGDIDLTCFIDTSSLIRYKSVISIWTVISISPWISMQDWSKKRCRQAGIQSWGDFTGIQFSGATISSPASRRKIRALILLESSRSHLVPLFLWLQYRIEAVKSK